MKNSTILLGFLPYQDNRYLTFNKVKSLGGQVNKGEKSHFVYFWQFIEKTVTDPETGKTEKIKFPFAKGYRVFNVEQCSGLNLAPCKAINLDNNPIDDAVNIWNNYADKPELYHNANSAFYDIINDYISVPEIHQFENSEAYYSTLFHEAIHSTGAKKRLNRDMKGYSQDKQSYGYEELVAEIGAQLLYNHAYHRTKQSEQADLYTKRHHYPQIPKVSRTASNSSPTSPTSIKSTTIIPDIPTNIAWSSLPDLLSICEAAATSIPTPATFNIRLTSIIFLLFLL